MSGRRIELTDAKLERALTVTARSGLAAELSEDVGALIRTTPQDRGLVAGLLGRGTIAPQTLRPAIVFVGLVALLLAATVALALVGSRVPRPLLGGNGLIAFGSD